MSDAVAVLYGRGVTGKPWASVLVDPAEVVGGELVVLFEYGQPMNAAALVKLPKPAREALAAWPTCMRIVYAGEVVHEQDVTLDRPLLPGDALRLELVKRRPPRERYLSDDGVG